LVKLLGRVHKQTMTQSDAMVCWYYDFSVNL